MLGRQTSCCGFSPPINAVEDFFAKLTTRRLKRGVFVSVVDLQAAINRLVAEHNTKPRYGADLRTISVRHLTAS
jgi:hypothetical protein